MLLMMLFNCVASVNTYTCHACSLVYRDTKPQNAGFDVRGDVKVNALISWFVCIVFSAQIMINPPLFL